MRLGWPSASCTVAVLALGFAAPSPNGAWLGFLVFPGLGALYLACRRERGALGLWVSGIVYLLWVSRSLVHVAGPGIVAIAALGAVYWLLLRLWTRAGVRFGAPTFAFACGVAATEWLRAHMPEIPYPHAQPCHALAAFPNLLGSLGWGGEPLANFLIAWCAAAVGQRIHAKRGPVPSLPCVLFVLTWLISSPKNAVAAEPRAMTVLLLQSDFPLPDSPRGERTTDPLRALERRTRSALESARERGGVLVVWPESSLPSYVDGAPPRIRPPLGLDLPERVQLLASTVRFEGAMVWAIATLLDHRGELLGFSEKQVPVPAGERVPGLGLLPESLRGTLLDWCQGIVGFRPDLQPGRFRPPLRTASGVPVGALICFDNAFDGVARSQVEAGARLLAVLSNESWYRGGVELDQMLAMTVCRALETDTPVVRSTVDGITCAVSARGEILACLPRGAGQGPQDLELEIELGSGSLPPLAWLHDVLRILFLCSGLGVALHLVSAWGRLRPSQPAADAHVRGPGALDSDAPHRRP